MADEGFDPEGFVKGTDDLPEVTPSLTTFYYPNDPQTTRSLGLDPAMEGGPTGAGKFSDLDLRNHTLEQYLNGKSDFVAVALPGQPTGAEFKINVLGNTVVGKNVDTGGGLHGSHADIATSDPNLARTGIEHGFDPNAFISDRPAYHPSLVATTAPDRMPSVQFDPKAFMTGEPSTADDEEQKKQPSFIESLGKGLTSAGEAIGGRGKVMAAVKPELIIDPQFQITHRPAPSTLIQTTQAPPMPQAAPAPLPTPQPMPPPASILERARTAFSKFEADNPYPQPFTPPAAANTLASLAFPQAAYTGQVIESGAGAISNFIQGHPISDITGMTPRAKELVGKANDTEPYSQERFNASMVMLAQSGMMGAVSGPSQGMSREIPGAIAGKPPPGGRQVAVAKPAAAEPVAGQQYETKIQSGVPRENVGVGVPTRTKEIPEGFIEEGINQEHPDVAAHIDRYSHSQEASGLTDALKNEDYPGYYEDLQRVLKRVYGDEPIPVTRVEGYEPGSHGKGVGNHISVSTNPRWGEGAAKRGAKVIKGFVNREDVVAAGNEAEGELIIKKGSLKSAAKPPAAPPAKPPPPPEPPPPSEPLPPENIPQLLRQKEIVKMISRRDGSVFTRADYDARQLTGPLRQDFGAELKRPPSDPKNIQANKDMEAATFVAEAQGLKSNLQVDAALIKASKDTKLATKYGPIIQYALDNFERLSKLPNRYGKLMQDQLAQDQAAGIKYSEREGYVTHVLKNEPDNSLISFFTGGRSGSGLSRYFTKSREFNTLAEAINAGVEPASVNIADLAQHRIAASRRLIIQKALFNELKGIAGPDGRPVVASMGRGGETPRGYDNIRANGVDLAVHPDYSGLFKALYGDSALRRTGKGRAFMKIVGVLKSYTLAADTYHGFRGIQKNLFYGGKGSRLGYDRGLTVYELNNEALDKEVAQGTLTRDQADWAKKARPHIEAMIDQGLNVSKFADNIVGQLHVNFPGTRGLNDWIFNRVYRGAMIQAAHANYLRNRARFPELSDEQVATKTATEMNEVFGNLMSQGMFKDKTIRDLANVTILSPQWVESQVRAEFRGYGQMGKILPDIWNNKFRVGVVAQGQMTAVLAYLTGNQIINYLTTGHSTLGNPEGHRLAAFIPVGKRGIYLDPLALGAEYADRFYQVMHRQGDKGTIASVVAEMAQNKLSRLGRAVLTLVTQRDWRGRQLHGSEVYKTAATDLIPLPIFASGTIQTDPQSGYVFNPTSERVLQQLLQGAGMRATVGEQPPQPKVPLRPVPMRTVPMKRQTLKTVPMR